MSFLEISGLELVEESERRPLTATLKKIHKHADLPELYVTLTLVNDQEMQALNLKWRGKNKSTDVLSFAAQEGDVMPGTEQILGDVVISADRARAQAEEFGHTFYEEMAVLFAHGILHLLGLDHEKSDEEAQRQRACEMAILDLADIRPELALCARTAEHDGG